MKYPYELPALPYAFDALEPHIDARTMEIHHGKHHGGYVTKLNDALAKWPEGQTRELEEILKNSDAVPEEIRKAVRNNGGGHYNHSLFWKAMKKGGGGEPAGEFADTIKNNFGDFAKFKEAFTAAALSVFGSGWAWLAKDAAGKLSVISMPNQDTPLAQNLTPLLGLDVWEHAYYLKYQNRRAEYVEAWWNVVDWEGYGKT